MLIKKHSGFVFIKEIAIKCVDGYKDMDDGKLLY